MIANVNRTDQQSVGFSRVSSDARAPQSVGTVAQVELRSIQQKAQTSCVSFEVKRGRSRRPRAKKEARKP